MKPFGSLAALLLTTVMILSGQSSAADGTATTAAGLPSEVAFARVGDLSLTLDAFVPTGKAPFRRVSWCMAARSPKGQTERS
jgi:hypothetical protein